MILPVLKLVKDVILNVKFALELKVIAKHVELQ